MGVGGGWEAEGGLNHQRKSRCVFRTIMNLHGQINDACESRPGCPQPCHWSVWIVLAIVWLSC